MVLSSKGLMAKMDIAETFNKQNDTGLKSVGIFFTNGMHFIGSTMMLNNFIQLYDGSNDEYDANNPVDVLGAVADALSNKFTAKNKEGIAQ